MKRKNLIILCFSALLLLVAIYGGIREQQWSRNHSISAEVISGDRTEEVKLWMGPGERFYLFLPGYADPAQVQLRRNLLGPVYLDGKRVVRGMNLGDFPMEEPLELIHDPRFGYQWNEVTILQSSGVPTLYIDVRSGNMDYIHGEKGNKEAGTMRLYTADGKLDAEAVVESLQGRGNSTWLWREKKPYSLRLSGETDLLGMGQASNWILLADAFDLSLLNNKLSYDLAREAGMAYTPDGQWVDLYLNGEFAGLYLLSERNEIHPNRVDIPPESSFLVSWEPERRMVEQGYPYVKTAGGTTLRIHQTAFSLEKIQSLWQSVENAVFAEDSVDPVTGKSLEELIDLDSWAMLYLMDEISADFDGGLLSKFFYYSEQEGTGKIYAGPLWDKDDAYGTGHWAVTPPNCIVAARSDRRIFSHLLQKDLFSSRVIQLYQNSFVPVLEQLCDTGIEAYADQISQAADLHEIRWILGYTPEESQITRDFLRARMDFLSAYWTQNEAYHHVYVRNTFDESRGEFAVRSGEALTILPEYAPEAGIWGWYLEDTEEPFDITQPILEDKNLILKKIG